MSTLCYRNILLSELNLVRQKAVFNHLMDLYSGGLFSVCQCFGAAHV